MVAVAVAAPPPHFPNSHTSLKALLAYRSAFCALELSFFSGPSSAGMYTKTMRVPKSEAKRS